MSGLTAEQQQQIRRWVETAPPLPPENQRQVEEIVADIKRRKCGQSQEEGAGD